MPMNMSIYMKNYLSLLLISLLLAGCKGEDDGLSGTGSGRGDTLVDIPQVQVEVPTSDIPASYQSRQVVVALFLSQISCATWSTQTPEARASVSMTCDSSNCQGTTTSWQKSSGVPVSQLLNYRYYYCAFLDLDADKKFDSGEYYDSSGNSVLIESAFRILVDSMVILN